MDEALTQAIFVNKISFIPKTSELTVARSDYSITTIFNVIPRNLLSPMLIVKLSKNYKTGQTWTRISSISTY